MKQRRNKSNGFTRQMWMLPIFLVALVALVLGAAAPEAWAKSWNHWAKSWNHRDYGFDGYDDGVEIPFAETKIIFEVNATDGDAGVQVFVDGEGWKELEIERPDGRKILDVEARRSLKQQGLTEFFFESAEPSFEDQSLPELLELFPEGEYEFEGETVEGDELEGEATLSHVIPCGPEVGFKLGPPVVISWDPVTSLIDPALTEEAGEVVCVDPEDELEIEGYQVIVEGADGDFDITLPDDAKEVTLPPEFELGPESKFEVLAIAENGNQTITEEEFFPTP